MYSVFQISICKVHRSMTPRKIDLETKRNRKLFQKVFWNRGWRDVYVWRWKPKKGLMEKCDQGVAGMDVHTRLKIQGEGQGGFRTFSLRLFEEGGVKLFWFYWIIKKFFEKFLGGPVLYLSPMCAAMGKQKCSTGPSFHFKKFQQKIFRKIFMILSFELDVMCLLLNAII